MPMDGCLLVHICNLQAICSVKSFLFFSPTRFCNPSVDLNHDRCVAEPMFQ